MEEKTENRLERERISASVTKLENRTEGINARG